MPTAGATVISRRRRAFAGPTRDRLLAALRRSEEPLGVQELAVAVGLHTNSVREQLDRLVAVGLVRREAAAPAGRGRPRLRYRVAPGAFPDVTPPDRALADLLADELSREPDGRATAIRAGERWGAAAARDPGPPGGSADPVDTIVGLLDDAGFAPDVPLRHGDPIELRRCPFEALASRHAEIVCGVHLGFLRGALRQLGSAVEPALQPFVAPDLCLVHLGVRTDD